MNIFNTVILAIIQSITEFLPISSSGHLLLAKEFLDLNNLLTSISFDIVLHFGTLVSLLFYFRKDILQIFHDLWDKDKKSDLFWNIFVATIPIVFVGYLMSNFIENSLRSTEIVIFNLVFIALLFLLAEKKSKHNKDLKNLTLINAFLIGLAQTIALIPGVSRSGITIVTALFLGFKRDSAARFSFLIAIPATTLVSLKGFLDISKNDEMLSSLDVYLLGFLVSAIGGFLAIKYLIKFLKNHSLKPFAYYRIVLALIFLFIIIL